jgi:hypothetical protein
VHADDLEAVVSSQFASSLVGIGIVDVGEDMHRVCSQLEKLPALRCLALNGRTDEQTLTESLVKRLKVVGLRDSRYMANVLSRDDLPEGVLHLSMWDARWLRFYDKLAPWMGLKDILESFLEEIESRIDPDDHGGATDVDVDALRDDMNATVGKLDLTEYGLVELGFLKFRDQDGELWELCWDGDGIALVEAEE